MDEEGFRDFMRRNKRSRNAIERAVRLIYEYEQFLSQTTRSTTLDMASPEVLQEFTQWSDQQKKNTKMYLWALRYYYEYISNNELRWLAGELREQRMKRAPMALKEFPGVLTENIDKLASAGIRNVTQLLKAAETEGEREELSEKTDIPPEVILELVKLANLTRIPGIRGIRARLYYDAGVETLEKMAEWNPDELRTMLSEFVERTKFDGIAPWPSEAKYSVAVAKKLIRGESPSSINLDEVQEKERHRQS